MKDLGSAPHRHASTQKPLSRFILLLDAMLSTATEILISKTGKPQERCRAFLEQVNEEDLLYLSLLADAGCESGEILRLFDSDVIDLMMVPYDLQVFLDRINTLFLKRGALHCGYTAYLTKYLETSDRAMARLRQDSIHFYYY